jgi:hypothetical protein
VTFSTGDQVRFMGTSDADVATGDVGTVVHEHDGWVYVDWPRSGVGGALLAEVELVEAPPAGPGR